MNPKEVAEKQIECLETSISNLQIKKENELAKTDPLNEAAIKQVNDYYKIQLELVESQKAEWEKVLSL